MPVGSISRVVVCVALFLTTLLGGAVAYAHWSAPMTQLTFNLTDQDGQTSTADNFRGQPLLVFFGFTGCSAICPATLTRIHDLIEHNTDLRGLLITTDPANDTPGALKNYLSSFNSRITGLTGNTKNLENVYAAFRAWPGNKGQSDHSGFIYLIDAKGYPRSHYTLQMSEAEMAASIQQDLAHPGENHE